jgi:hypothetical protein
LAICTLEWCGSTESSVEPELPIELVARWSQVNLESQNAALKSGRGIANHGVVLEVEPCSLNESLAIGPFNWWQASALNGVGTLTKS